MVWNRKKPPVSTAVFTVKRCLDCGTYMKLEAERCPFCKHRVGGVDKNGIAKKPLDWKAYVISILVWIGFSYYMWWAFFRD